MATKKPGDETIRVVPQVLGGPEDSFVGRMKVSSGELKKVERATEAAPEVSQGLWRERPYTARAVMPREEIRSALLASVRVVLQSASHPRVALEALKPAWLPVLRQALEQAGGDGIDSWLVRRLTGFNQPSRHDLFDALGEAWLRLRAAKDVATFEEEALKVPGLIDRAFDSGHPRLSFKQMEKELEGKLEVDELLAVRGAGVDELSARLSEIGNTMTSLRDQLKRMPGRQPGGIYANFVRLKAELRVIDAELKARG